jgi:hypothetical protein
MPMKKPAGIDYLSEERTAKSVENSVTGEKR